MNERVASLRVEAVEHLLVSACARPSRSAGERGTSALQPVPDSALPQVRTRGMRDAGERREATTLSSTTLATIALIQQAFVSVAPREQLRRRRAKDGERWRVAAVCAGRLG